MATNHTSNYNLNQYAANDSFLRTDFNEDNTKIDTALHSLALKCDIVWGTYTGTCNGSANFTQTITLGFRPRLVYVSPYGASTSGHFELPTALALDGIDALHLKIIDTGFTVSSACNIANRNENGYSERSPYRYIALR